MVGPTLGGWITDNYSWRWIFYINVPVGVISLALTYWFLVEPKAEKKHREEMRRNGLKVDYIGFGLVALGLGCLQVVLDKGQREDWFGSNFIVFFSVVSAASLVAMVVWELTRRDPIVDLRLLGNRGFAAANIVMLAVGFILFSTTQLLPQMVQEIFGYTATQAGLVITPGGIGVIILMPIVGLLLRKVQPRTLIAFGWIVECLALLHLSHFTSDVNFGRFVWGANFSSGRDCVFIRAGNDRSVCRAAAGEE